MGDEADCDFHASVPFLETFRDALYPGQRSSIELITVAGAVYRMLVVDGQPLVYTQEYPCYHTPLRGDQRGREWPGLRLRLTAGAVEPVHTVDRSARVAPFVDWSSYPTFDDYLRDRDLYRRFRTARNRRNHLEKTVGRVEVVEHDTVPGVLELVLGWKAAQARRRGWQNVFALERTRNMYRLLRQRGLQQLTTLRIGGRVVAGSAWTRWDGVLSWRLTAQDPEFARYPVGTILFHHLLHQSFEAGDRQLNLLMGAEEYKIRHATHLLRLRPAGAPYKKDWPHPRHWPAFARALHSRFGAGRAETAKAPRSRQDAP
jgi:hypothetical protein